MKNSMNSDHTSSLPRWEEINGRWTSLFSCHPPTLPPPRWRWELDFQSKGKRDEFQRKNVNIQEVQNSHAEHTPRKRWRCGRACAARRSRFTFLSLILLSLD